MFIRVKATAKASKKKVQICESIREGDKVKQIIVQHVGVAHSDSELDSLKRLAQSLMRKIRDERDGPFLFPVEELFPDPEEKEEEKEIFTVPELPIVQETIPPVIPKDEEKLEVDLQDVSEQQRRVDGFHEIFGKLFSSCGFDQVLNSKKSEVLRELVLARIANPGSKRASQEMLTAEFGVEISLDRMYRVMDSLVEHENEFQKMVFLNTQSLCFGEVLMTFFDVTTLYFESVEEDELRKFGYSKDQQFQSVQVVLALATTQDGLPIGYKTFPGNTAEVSTLLKCLEEWKEHLPIGQVTIVADRAMMSEANLSELEAAGIKYVIAAKLKKLPTEIRGALLSKQGKEAIIEGEVHDLQEHKLSSHRRLVATYSEKRARKDRKDRDKILEKLTKKLGSGKRVKSLVSNRGYQKYLKAEGEATLVVDEEKLSQEASWDGLHGIVTNDQEAKAEDLLALYRRQWIIEESFRIHKTDLSIRPIYHFKPERVQAHILLCYLCFALMRYAEHRIRLQKGNVSMQEIRKALWRTQSSLLKDHRTGMLYRVPSKPSALTKDIYQTFGLVRNQKITKLETRL